MMLVLLAMVVVGGIVGRTIFSSVDLSNDGSKYFGSTQRSIWHVFVAITSSSFPDQIVAAYDDSRPSIIYFFVVISIGAFLYLNVLQVVVFTSFESGRNRCDQESAAVRKESLERAFNALDVMNLGFVTHSQVNDILDEMYENYYSFRKFGVPSRRERLLLVRAMDSNGDGKVYRNEFMLVLELTRITVVEEVRLHILDVLFFSSFALLFVLGSGPLFGEILAFTCG